MKRILFLLAIIGAFIYAFPAETDAQDLPVTLHLLNDYYRTMQLKGEVDSNISFTVRPLTASALKHFDVFDPDSTKKAAHWIEA